VTIGSSGTANFSYGLSRTRLEECRMHLTLTVLIYSEDYGRFPSSGVGYCAAAWVVVLSKLWFVGIAFDLLVSADYKSLLSPCRKRPKRNGQLCFKLGKFRDKRGIP
jgi:hypothetical protein